MASAKTDSGKRVTSGILTPVTKRVSISIALLLLSCAAASAQARKIKVIADQDSGGPQGTNFLSLLMLLRAPQVDLLGITTVSGDQWMEPATVANRWGISCRRRNFIRQLCTGT